MKSSFKIQKLEAQIEALRVQQNQLIQERNLEIAEVIHALALHTFDPRILVGGLIHIAESLSYDTPEMEEWQDAGEKFLRQLGRPTRRSQHATNSRKNQTHLQKRTTTAEATDEDE